MKTALIIVDIQKDFCPGGALGVEEGDRVVEPANRLIRYFERQHWPIYFTRDWHPANHCSFRDAGGPWPPHCVADSNGAAFHENLYVPETAEIISKATTKEKDAYSAFEGTGLGDRLRIQGVDAIIIAGLTTDYCVKHTVLDAFRSGLTASVAEDAIRAVNVEPDDGPTAIRLMKEIGAHFDDTDTIIRRFESK